MRITAIMLLGSLSLGAQILKIDGGAAPMENIFKPLRASFEQKTGLRLDLRENGPELALLSLQKGEIDAAAAGLSTKAWFEMMAEKGHKGLRSEDFIARVIGFDKINVLINANVAVLSLEKADLKRIFTGEARNWKEFGGANVAIVVVLGDKVPGTNKVFQDQILDKAPFAKDALRVGATPEILKTISETPGAIGFGPVATLRDLRLSSPATPEVGRPITLLTRPGTSPELQKLVEGIQEWSRVK